MKTKQNDLVEIKVYFYDSYNEQDMYIITGKDDMDRLDIDEDDLESIYVPKKEHEKYLNNIERVKPLNKFIGDFKRRCLAIAVNEHPTRHSQYEKRRVENNKDSQWPYCWVEKHTHDTDWG